MDEAVNPMLKQAGHSDALKFRCRRHCGQGTLLVLIAILAAKSAGSGLAYAQTDYRFNPRVEPSQVFDARTSSSTPPEWRPISDRYSNPEYRSGSNLSSCDTESFSGSWNGQSTSSPFDPQPEPSLHQEAYGSYRDQPFAAAQQRPRNLNANRSNAALDPYFNRTGPYSGNTETVYDPGEVFDDPAASRGDCTLYMPFVSMGYAGGQTPSTSYNELFVPLLQSQTDLFYADVRGLLNVQSAYQGSFGGGVRSLIGDAAILGGYGFYDFRHVQSGMSFQQATVGIELMTWFWEARSNGYIPTYETGGANSGHAAGTAFLQNGALYLQGTQQAALSGVDAEFGALLAADPTATQELRGFVGGYFFNAPGGSQDLAGISTRLEARIYDLGFLGEGSRLEFGAIANYDDVNHLQVTGLVNVRIALGQSNCPGHMSRLERRMLDRPIRRYDVVTTDDSTFVEPATAIVNGRPAGAIVEVKPGDDLKTAVETAPANALVLVEGGTYSIPNGIVLSQGESVVGGGATLTVVGNLTGHTGLFTTPGSIPTIDRPNALGPTITVNPDNALINLNVQGGTNAIYGYDADDLMIANVTISNTANDGLYLDDVDGFRMSNVTISQTGGMGASLWNVNNSWIDGLTISQTVGSAIYYNCGDHVQMNGLTVDATGATDDAVRIHTQTHSVFTNFDIRNSTHNGLTIGSSTNVSFDQIRLTNIALDGFQANQSGTFTLSHLNMDTVGGSGLVIDNTALVSLNNSTFGNVNNVISYLNIANYISGSDNIATGYNSLYTGTTNGGGSIQFTTPNATAP